MKNKLLVVSGATRGIGRAISERFANEGYNLAGCARTDKDIQSMGEHFSMVFPKVNCDLEKADLSSLIDVSRFGEFVKGLKKDVDVLVNNAGYFLPGQINNEPPGTLESMMSANLYSAYHLTRALLPAMIKAKKGHIFNICSTASITPYINGGSYCIAKHALLGFSRVLREELKPHNIKVTAVLPGATLTSSWEGTDLPEDRFMKPEDVAQIIYDISRMSPNTVTEEILLRPQLGDI